MPYHLIAIILLLTNLSCVKEDGKVSDGQSADGGTTGTNGSGGTSTGSSGSGDDPLAAEAWHLKNTGIQKAYSKSSGKAGEDINVEDVHLRLNIRGRGVRIAVSDSGTETEHPELDGNALDGEHRNYTFANPLSWKNADPYPSDEEAHGTAVTGLISALGWNGIGSRGVAPESKFAAFRFIFSLPEYETEASYLAKQIDQLYGNFDIFNFSYGLDGRGFFQHEETIEEALELGVTTLRNGKGAIYIQAAGNDFLNSYKIGTKTYYVSGNANAHADLATPYKIVVGATNASMEKSSYSSVGSSIWVSAPGGEYGDLEPAMITTDIRGCNSGMSYKNILKPLEFNYGNHLMNRLCDYTSTMNGTSSATPVVAGVVALMLEANKNLTWRDVKHILAETSDEINYDPILASFDHPLGYDLYNYDYDFLWVENKAGYEFSNWYGFGRVNAKEAVEMAATWKSSNLGTFEQTKNSLGTWYYDSGVLTSKTILDENAFALEDEIWVGHNFIIENIQISVTTDHPFPGDLGIVLESPQGTESRILNVNSKIYGDGLDDFIMATNAFYGEESEGFWKIKVVDGDSTFGTGDLLRWKILVNGHRKSTDLNKPYPPTSIIFTGAPSSTDKSPVFAFVKSVSSSVSRYEAQVERASDGLVMKAWTNLGLVNSEHQFTGMALATGVVYQLKIRTINSSGQTSSIQLKEWTAN